jgi:hypothetical protein
LCWCIAVLGIHGALAILRRGCCSPSGLIPWPLFCRFLFIWYCVAISGVVVRGLPCRIVHCTSWIYVDRFDISLGFWFTI